MPDLVIRAHQTGLNDEEGNYYNMSSAYEGWRNYYGPMVRFSVPEGSWRIREDIALKLMEQYLIGAGYAVFSPETLAALRNVTGQDIG